MYIYADILIITNIYVDFLLIKSAQTITHSPLKASRGCIAAVIGSLFSLVIFMPKMSAAVMILIKTASAALTVLAAFGYESRRAYLKRLFVFWLASFIYGGVGTAVSYFAGGRLFVSRNGVIYADFSMAALVITSIAAYLSIAVYKRLADCSEEGAVYTVIVSDNDMTVSFKAIADTGNVLKDSFTGKPVIVCGKKTLERLYGSVPDEKALTEASGRGELADGLAGRLAVKKRWRLIPYRTASGGGLIPIICPREICIKNDETGDISTADAYLGAAPLENDLALFHPKILL